MTQGLAVSLPLGQTRAAFRPETFDAAARTIELVWTTGARVRRESWDGPWLEELSLDPEAVDLRRLNAGANLLAAHNAFSLDGILGVVESAWLEGGARREGRARVRLSAEDVDAPIVRKIQDGIIRQVSVGYITHKREELDAGTRAKGPPVFRATLWEPVEVSLVAVAADAGAHVRNGQQQSTAAAGSAWADAVFPCLTTRRSDMDDLSTTERPAAKAKRPLRSRAAAERPPGQDPEHEPPEDEEETPPPVPPAPEEKPEGGTGYEPKFAASDTERVLADERKRVQEIRTAVRAVGLQESFADRFIADGTAIADVRTAVLAEKARAQAPVARSTIEVVSAASLDRLHRGIVEALLHRVDPGRYPVTDIGRDWRGHTLREIARACLEARGVRTKGIAPMELAALALGLAHPTHMQYREGPHSFLTTTDFTTLLAQVGRAQLTAGYTAAERTFPPWTRQGTLPDFRPTSKISLGLGPKLLKVQEHGEYTRGPLATAPVESMKLDTYGRILAFTRQAMINDDVGLFGRIPQLFGNAAAAMESDAVYAILTGNPTMVDTFALFSAQHGNLMTASVIDVKNMALARTAMMTQKSPDGQYINITPRFLIVGPQQEVYALQFLAPLTIVSSTNQNIPTEYRSLQLVVDPRITDAAWYLGADPNQIDTIEYDYLEGAAGGGPALETREGWDIDGQEYKAREEFAAKALDYRGLVKNPGVLPA